MSALSILALVGTALLVNIIRPRRFIGGVVLIFSALSIFWFQPLSAIRNMDFWLPMLSITLTVVIWAITYPGERDSMRPMLPGLSILVLVILAVALMRYSDTLCCLTSSPPPHIQFALAAVGLIVTLSLVLFFAPLRQGVLLWAAFALLIILFVILKSAPLAEHASAWIRNLMGQSPDLASPTDLTWLGYSFLAFRLLHAIRDRQANRLPAFSLQDFASYALFFPAVISGPIDKSQHFIQELERIRNEPPETNRAQTLKNLVNGIPRILIGAFKKFVLADSLALFALNAQNAAQTSSTGWLWFMLFAYALRIYFDFSGYTDVALGTAQLMGIRLPENFNLPYLKSNLTAFWNAWHITLSQWFRSYVFFPFTRAMRARSGFLQTWMIILCGQLITMTLIGLWHGITWNFLIWGAWHGLGLFFHNRWSDWIKPRIKIEEWRPICRTVLQGSSMLATIIFVCLGWVWFALPDPQTALAVFARLLGIGGS